MFLLRRFSHVRCALGTCSRLVFLVVLLLLSVSAAQGAEGQAKCRWFKGTTHSHSLWSDGNQFPDMVVDWFKSHGYDFFCLTDHNVLMEGERWVKPAQSRRPLPNDAVEKYIDRFGESWVKTRGDGKDLEVRLRTFKEIKTRMASPGKFLLIQGEEISGGTSKPPSRAIHVNALNLVELIKPQKGATSAEAIRADLLAGAAQSKKIKRPILMHVNHPNFAGYPITARDLAEVAEVRFVEICNNHNGVCHYGDKNHPSVERLWDIANTLRLAEKRLPPIYGVATDDSHNYHAVDPKAANPGRGWIVVRAERLATNPLLRAMSRGDFYASTGVELAALDYDPVQSTLHVAVAPKPDTRYTIEFIGTPAGVTLPADADLNKCAEIGKVLASHEATSATYKLTGDELYVRAFIRSNRKMAGPSQTGVKNEQAWTQPIGWERRVNKSSP